MIAIEMASLHRLSVLVFEKRDFVTWHKLSGNKVVLGILGIHLCFH